MMDVVDRAARFSIHRRAQTAEWAPTNWDVPFPDGPGEEERRRSHSVRRRRPSCQHLDMSLIAHRCDSRLVAASVHAIGVRVDLTGTTHGDP